MRYKKVIKASKRPIRADIDAQAFKERRLRIRDQREQRKAQKTSNIVNQINASDNPISTAFELLVPASGNAPTVAGEIIRAINRIIYRDLNDGDVFYEGYGIDTCGDAVAFLCNKIPDLHRDFDAIARRTETGDLYTRDLQSIGDQIIDYLLNNQELFTQENTEDMYDMDGEAFIEEQGWVTEYEVDCYLPDNLSDHIAVGHISSEDVKDEIESWDWHYTSDGEVNIGDNYIHISGLKKYDYEELEAHLYEWLEQWGEDLDIEYGNPHDEYEETETEAEDEE